MSIHQSKSSRQDSLAEDAFLESDSRHFRYVVVFGVIVLLHWMEHLVQAYQIWFLGRSIPEAGGVLGYYFPRLVSSEVMHYAYAVVMLVGLWLLRGGFTPPAFYWWTVAMVLQSWHHIEHLALIVQATLEFSLAGNGMPTSFLQLFFPRVELHLFYNTVVTIPMVVAMVLYRGSRRSGVHTTNRR